MAKIQIVFDGPPVAVAGRFVEVEQDGKGISIGDWRELNDGLWALEIDDPRRIANLERQISTIRNNALEDAARLMAACKDPEAAAAIRALK